MLSAMVTRQAASAQATGVGAAAAKKLSARTQVRHGSFHAYMSKQRAQQRLVAGEKAPASCKPATILESAAAVMIERCGAGAAGGAISPGSLRSFGSKTAAGWKRQPAGIDHAEVPSQFSTNGVLPDGLKTIGTCAVYLGGFFAGYVGLMGGFSPDTHPDGTPVKKARRNHDGVPSVPSATAWHQFWSNENLGAKKELSGKVVTIDAPICEAEHEMSTLNPLLQNIPVGDDQFPETERVSDVFHRKLANRIGARTTYSVTPVTLQEKPHGGSSSTFPGMRTWVVLEGGPTVYDMAQGEEFPEAEPTQNMTADQEYMIWLRRGVVGAPIARKPEVFDISA